MSAELASLVSKGTILQSGKPIAVIPFWKAADNADATYADVLPGYQPCPVLEQCKPVLLPVVEPALQSFLHKLYCDVSLEALAMLTTIELIYGGTSDACNELLDDRHDNHVLENDDSDKSWLIEGWPLIQEKIEWNDCVALYGRIYSNLHIVTLPHPLSEFAKDTLLYLPDNEFERAIQGAFEKKWVLQTTSNRLQASQFFLDYVASLPARRVGVLIALPYSQSCLPSAALEISATSVEGVCCTVVSLFDSISLEHVISTRPPTHRCNCLRCNHDRNPNAHRQSACTVEQTSRLAHHLFQQEEKYDEAKELYQYCHDQSSSHSEKADLWHAMGAIELTRHSFVCAQRHWRDGRNYASTHPGIALQLEKQDAYEYWRPLPTMESSSVPYDTICPKRLFVTPQMISTETCQQLIQWAEDVPEWTTSRHYAVPTNDVPVHQVPKLLEWFQNWMATSCQELLRQQFCTHHRFYVHDAFLARYQASSKSRFLPLHYDESTHSMVLVLNDDFEGGGTYFYSIDQTIEAATGSVVSFRGNQLLHGGNVVTKGVRYILAVFLYLDQDSCCDKDDKELPAKRPKMLGEKEEGFSFNFFGSS